MDTNARTIWKFTLPVTDRPQVEMPRGAVILAARILGGESYDLMDALSTQEVSVWATVDPSEPMVLRTFCIVGTGRPLPTGPLTYIATMPMQGGALIWHLFEDLS